MPATTIVTRLAVAVLCFAAINTVTTHATQPRGTTPALSFAGTEFIHRWSKDAQHEFTPTGNEDLNKWTAMMTINVHDWARTGDQLAELANRVLGNYQKAGKIIRTDSKPRTAKSEAEHFAVVLLPNPGFLEAAFARFVMHDNRGVAAVYSRRFYGDGAAREMGAWLQQNGAETEKALMAWTGIPSLAVLESLPSQ